MLKPTKVIVVSGVMLLSIVGAFNFGNHKANGSLAVAAVKKTQKAPPVNRRDSNLKLQNYNNGIFSIAKPNGWQLTMSGEGSSLAFLSWDPVRPLRQFFYFGSVGPVYMSNEQKQIDLNYMRSGGYPIGWIEMPVIQPFTVSNFFAHFNQIARTNVAQNFMPQCPRLDRFQIISAKSQNSMLPGGRTELIRALFIQNGQLAEGLFMATVVPYTPFMNGPGGGNGYGCMVMGLTAPQREFRNLQADLVSALRSFTINPAYAQSYIQQQEQVFARIMKAGQTLREAGDLIARGWQQRQRSEDIMSEKRSDAILGKERLYDPATGEVYDFQNGFYENYNLHRNRYQMNNLQPLPDNNYQLWTQAPLNGEKYLH